MLSTLGIEFNEEEKINLMLAVDSGNGTPLNHISGCTHSIAHPFTLPTNPINTLLTRAINTTHLITDGDGELSFDELWAIIFPENKLNLAGLI